MTLVTGGSGDGHWPAPTLDRLARMRVLGTALPGVAMSERTLDVPFDDVWAFVSDIERSVPSFDRDVWRLRVLRRSRPRSDEMLRIRAWPSPLPFAVDLREGWCLMHSRIYVVGMAAEPVNGGSATRFLHLEGIPATGPRWLQRVLAPVLGLFRRRHLRHVVHDLDGIERCLRAR